jgi:hypothetical protein
VCGKLIARRTTRWFGVGIVEAEAHIHMNIGVSDMSEHLVMRTILMCVLFQGLQGGM